MTKDDSTVRVEGKGQDLSQKEKKLKSSDPPARKVGDGTTIVGIGASAGGLKALQTFFDLIPVDSGMAFVIVTHLDPGRESHLPELLQDHTAMMVQLILGPVSIKPNQIYIPAPGKHIFVAGSHLNVEEIKEPVLQQAPIDRFFRRLAENYHDTIAIILSGTGTDGSVGIRAIKENGGLLLVQDPEEAEFESMPRAAINTGLADIVLPIAELTERLLLFQRTEPPLPKDPESLSAEELRVVYSILSYVQAQTGHDFSQYKSTTVLRRIRRRMQLHGLSSLARYLEYLISIDNEAQSLFNDLLIGVTHFFRDTIAWQTLTENVIPHLFTNKNQDDTVRVWSIGCATGEEAYSLVILLLEYQALLGIPILNQPGIQVFASDLDDEALCKARKGRYPEAIEAEISPERLERFFTKNGSYYQVKEEVRKKVLFSNHSFLRDPPFSRLDLISCRNVLIYLQRGMQHNVFQLFHYALRQESFLFLGTSESAEMVKELFRQLDKSHQIYQSRLWQHEIPKLPTLPIDGRSALRRQIMQPPFENHLIIGGDSGPSAISFHIDALERFSPPSILIDSSYHIVHLSETAGRYLQLPRGTISSNLLSVVRPELQFELRITVFRAFEQNKSLVTQPVAVQFNGHPHLVTVALRPQTLTTTSTVNVNDQWDEQMMLVFFFEDEITESPANQLSDFNPELQKRKELQIIVVQLEEEVRRLRQRLQTTTDEFVRANEEVKSANEELQSINEEYHSTTEELETSKEELQSVNEELQTVNSELKNKLDVISEAHSDMENFIASTNFATLFLNRELRIERYTPATTELFNILPGDIGRPISHLTNKLDYENLTEDAVQVLKNLTPVEREVQDSKGHYLILKVRPYRTSDHRIDGVILTFVDITNRKKSELALQLREQELAALNKTLETRVKERTDELRLEKEYNSNIVDTICPSS